MESCLSLRSADRSIQSKSEESLSEVFMPKDKLDQPCDIVLIVEGGKELKAHRRILSEASPFFENLLKSDMKESKEGIVRLEMFSRSVAAATLEFIYTGDVEIEDENNAQDLIVVADYLFLQKLKTLAGRVLEEKLDVSNCISTYYFSERYQCEELLFKTRDFILANFTVVYAANREDVLNMLSKEVKMWISSDEINVNAEEDVFKFILEWIDHDRRQRVKHFAELFRQVRLDSLSRDFLSSVILTSDLVKDGEGSLDSVKGAINSSDSKEFLSFSVPPRKSLETHGILVNCSKDIHCYFPREDSWRWLGKIRKTSPEYQYRVRRRFVQCKGKLYSTKLKSDLYQPQSLDQEIYNPHSNSWVKLKDLKEDRYFRHIFVTNGDMYAFMSEPCTMDHIENWNLRGANIRAYRRHKINHKNCAGRKHFSFLTRYKQESNSWEDASSFNYLDLRQDFCIVARDNYVYFIGGIEWPRDECTGTFLSDVDRYDLSKNQWNKVADIQAARTEPHGAALNGKVFIAGGYCQGSWSHLVPEEHRCEVYNETTNEWHFIACFNVRKNAIFSVQDLLAVDNKLCAVVTGYSYENRYIWIACYDPYKDEWNLKTQHFFPDGETPWNACSVRVFKGLAETLPKPRQNYPDIYLEDI